MSLSLSPLGKIKTGVHAVQAALIFIAACIALAMDTKQGHSDGRGRWFNILCYFSIPALVYLAMVPIWERSQRFANLFAFIAVDAVFLIFWLSAWASLVSWVREGMSSGAALKNMPTANCTTFDPSFGVPEKCSLANDCVGFGVVIFLLFIVSTVLSVMYLMKSRKDPDNDRPWLGKDYGRAATDPEAAGGAAGKDGVWSTDTQDIGGEDDHNRAPSDGTDRGGDQEEDEYHLLQGTDAELGNRPGRRWDQRADAEYQRTDEYPPAPPEYDTEYRGAHGGHGYDAPHRDGYLEDASDPVAQQPVTFPSTPYGYRGRE